MKLSGVVIALLGAVAALDTASAHIGPQDQTPAADQCAKRKAKLAGECKSISVEGNYSSCLGSHTYKIRENKEPSQDQIGTTYTCAIIRPNDDGTYDQEIYRQLKSGKVVRTKFVMEKGKDGERDKIRDFNVWNDQGMLECTKLSANDAKWDWCGHTGDGAPAGHYRRVKFPFQANSPEFYDVMTGKTVLKQMPANEIKTVAPVEGAAGDGGASR